SDASPREVDSGSEVFCGVVLAQLRPHFDHAALQFRGELGVRFLGSFGFGWRVHGISNHHLQRRESFESLSAWPRVIESVNRYRNNRNLQMDGQNCRALLENLWLTIDCPFAFRIKNEYAPRLQPGGTRSHGRYQVRIWIDHYHAQPSRQRPQKALAED